MLAENKEETVLAVFFGVVVVLEVETVGTGVATGVASAVAFFFFLVLLLVLALVEEVLEGVEETEGVLDAWSAKTLVPTIKAGIKRIAKDFFILPPRNGP